MKKIIVEGTPKEIREYENKEDSQLDKVLTTEPDTPVKESLECPEKVTIFWLKEHVSIPQWFYLAGVILALFVSGVQASKLTFVQEIFGIENCIKNTTPNNTSTDKKAPKSGKG